MKLRPGRVICLIVVFAIVLLASCQCHQKPFHQENERYILVSTNIELPYWQKAKAGPIDAARQLGVKAELTGPTSYAPNEELDAFQKAVAKHPAGILLSAAREDIFKDAIDSAIQQG